MTHNTPTSKEFIKRRKAAFARRNVAPYQAHKSFIITKREVPSVNGRKTPVVIHGRSSVPAPKPRLVTFDPGNRYGAMVKQAVKRRAKPAAKIATAPKKSKPKTTVTVTQKRKMALLLPGHNEELILATTIRTAIKGGQQKRDIFVVDDCSSDRTREVAIKMLGEANVLTVRRSGKALAVNKAVSHFRIKSRYIWLHVADADSIFGTDYFRIYKKNLDETKYAVAVGFVQSMRGNWLSNYRAITYTYSQHVNRRIQSYLGMISVFPGPITSFRTDILHKLDFTGSSLTEDFDVTLQVHRKKLGKIKFIPKAVNYTQDPQGLKDFCKQNLRWQRGFFQGVRKHRVGFKPRKIDVSIGYQMFQTIFYLMQMFIFMPMLIIMTGEWKALVVVLVADFIIVGLIAMLSSVAIKRWQLIGAIPYFYFLRWLELGIFIWAFIEVILLGRYKTEARGWATEGRRYKLSKQALRDAATN